MKILVLGKGLVGSAISDCFSKENSLQVTSVDSRECDLRNSSNIRELLDYAKPEVVVLAAGIVGGIEKNLGDPVGLIMENSKIILNVIDVSLEFKIKRLINLVPACVYPGNLKHRMGPLDLFSSPMENSSLAYSMSKLTGLVMVSSIRNQYNLDWVSIIPTNVYGADSKVDSHSAHVIPALISKILLAKKLDKNELELLGDGSPVREFLHVADLSTAVLRIVQRGNSPTGIINVAGNDETTIKSLANLICELTGFKGAISFKSPESNGALIKLLDGSEIQKLGWKPKISLREGLNGILKNL